MSRPALPTTKPAVMLFEYHCWEDERSQDAKLWHHTGQPVLVVGKCHPDEADIDMYRVLFADGYRHVAFKDELLLPRKESE